VVEDARELWRSATVVGNWFLGLGEDGRPDVAGRINRGLGSGRYLVTYSFAKDKVRLEPVVTADQIGCMRWLLFDTASTWREAFINAERH
jgi:hypothetical protein